MIDAMLPNITTISSPEDLNRPELAMYTKLSENQLTHYYEPYGGLFIAESPMVVERAIRLGYEPVSLFMDDKYLQGHGDSLLDCCREFSPDLPIFSADFERLGKETGYRFQLSRGALCALKRKALPSVEEVCRNARRICILENVVNPTNVGAIFRSAAALNIDGILLTPASSDPLYRRAVRVSMATVFQIPWTFFDDPDTSIRVLQAQNMEHEPGNRNVDIDICTAADSDTVSNSGNDAAAAADSNNSYAASADKKNQRVFWPDGALDLLHEMGFKTVAMALKDNSVSMDDPRLLAEEKLAIIMGTEGDGLADHTIDNCDYTVRIPMAHGVDSLNVAAASAVAFWQLRVRS